jgi:hypothetical protein
MSNNLKRALEILEGKKLPKGARHLHDTIRAILGSNDPAKKQVESLLNIYSVLGADQRAADEYWASIFEALLTVNYADAHVFANELIEDLCRRMDNGIEWDTYRAHLLVIIAIIGTANWADEHPFYGPREFNEEFDVACPTLIGAILHSYAKYSADDGMDFAKPSKWSLGRFSEVFSIFCGYQSAVGKRERRIVALSTSLKEIESYSKSAEPVFNEIVSRMRYVLKTGPSMHALADGMIERVRLNAL